MTRPLTNVTQPSKLIFKASMLVLAAAVFSSACAKMNKDSGSSAETAKPVPVAEMEGGSESIVARIGDKTFTDAEIRKQQTVKMELYKAAQKVYEAKAREHEVFRSAVGVFIDEQVLEKAATAKGMNIQAFLKKEVDDKVGDVSDADIKAFYDEKKINRPLDSIKERIRDYLTEQGKAEKREVLMANLRKEYKASISVPDFMVAKPLPPKFDNITIPAHSPTRGEDNAPVEIVMFSDYQCSFCEKTEKTVMDLFDKYKGKIRLAMRHFPLPFHKEAKGAAVAAICAQKQGKDKFWSYHTKLFENQQALLKEDLVKYAEALKLDLDQFKTCMDDDANGEIVEKDLAAGRGYGVTGTPAFFINGRLLSGARPQKDFEDLINLELGAKS